MKKLILILIALLFKISLVSAQWQLVSGNGGPTYYDGDVVAIVAHGDTVFASTDNIFGAGGGVFASTDNGTSWTKVNNGIIHDLAIYSLCLSVTGDTVYAGSDDGYLYISTNNGASWSIVNEPSDLVNKGHVISSILNIGSSILLGTQGGGVYLSTDIGATWSNPLPGRTFGTLAADGPNIWAATIVDSLYVSNDGGASWKGIPSSPIWRPYVAATGPYIYTARQAGIGEINVSSDNGVNWNSISAGLPPSDGYSPILAMGANVFVGFGAYSDNGDGIYFSQNSGTSWNDFNAGLTYLDIQSMGVSGTTFFIGANNDTASTSGIWRRPLSDFSPTSTLNLKVFLQGFYAGAGTMNNSLFSLGYGHDLTATDTITVNLWAPSSLTNANPDYTAKVVVHTDGSATATFPTAVVGNDYYIAVTHKNHVETWSAAPVDFTLNTSYDFSTGESKAYGDGNNPPMKSMGGGVFTIYGGDVNHDGAIDSQDMTPVFNDSHNPNLFGYIVTDVNGDGVADSRDMTVIFNNSHLSGFFYARPH